MRRQKLVNLRIETANQFVLWVKEMEQLQQGTLSEIAANGVLVLLNVACSLLDRQLKAQADAFQKEGGFTERLYKMRSTARKNSH